MDIIDAIWSRRSIRRYTNDPVADDDIEQLLRAAMQAPSAVNEQPWHFVVLKDRTILDEIPAISSAAKMMKKAPVAVAVCADKDLENQKFPGFWMQDCSAATENLLLAATAKGFGAVWTGVYPLEDRVRGIKKLLNLPESVIPLCIVALGYPAETPAPVDRYNPTRVHYDSW